MKYKKVSVVIVTKDRKSDLVECVDSYIKSSYPNLEIIVVDNASRPSLLTWFPKKYKEVKLITSDVNLGAAEGRNIGLKASTGEYILFTDDDAYADKDMVKNLVQAFEDQGSKAGIIQPLVYDKKRKNLLQGAGHDIDLLTGRIKAWGVREEDNGQYEGLREVPMCGCVWMVRKEVFKKIGNYDEDYFIPYEDSDLSIRARKAGFKLYSLSSAKTWHQGIKKTFVSPRLEWLGITSPERAFRVARNKMIFMRKHSPFPQILFFFLVLEPMYLVAHSIIIISSLRWDVLAKYWSGVLFGLLYVIFYPLLGLRQIYKDVDKKLHPVKMWLLAWTDPTPGVFRGDVRSVLDLACGPGKLMQLIKMRRRITNAVGVDLFTSYLDEAKKEKIFDKYIVKDIRKINFPAKSFDAVLASHVLEHMPKDQAWKVLSNMERMARKQVIIATPIGEMYHPPVDGNILQLHQSDFEPWEFEKKGYKVVKYGLKWLLGEEGAVHVVKNDIARKILYTFNLLLTPVYFIFPSLCDYVFVAYKDIDD